MNDQTAPSPDNYIQELLQAEAEQIRLDAQREEEEIRLNAQRKEEEIRLETLRQQQAKAVLAETGLAKLRTLALEFDTTLQRCDRLRSEVDAFLLPREGINYAELAERLEGTLMPVSEWLAEWDLQPDAVHQGMSDWLNQALGTLNLRNGQTVLEKCHQQLQMTRVAAEQAAKAEVAREAEEGRRLAEAEEQRREKELHQAQAEQQKSELAGKYMATLQALVKHVSSYIDEGQRALWPEELAEENQWASWHPPVVDGLEILRNFKAGLLNLPPIPETAAQQQVLIAAIRDLERSRGLWAREATTGSNYWAIAWGMNMSIHCITKYFPNHAPSLVYFDELGASHDLGNSYCHIHHPRIFDGFAQLVKLAHQLPIEGEQP